VILYVTIPTPDGLNPNELKKIIEGSEVRHPHDGVVGEVFHAVSNWRDGQTELRLTVEISDRVALAEAVRAGSIY
jgi:hypothetical protein